MARPPAAARSGYEREKNAGDRKGTMANWPAQIVSASGFNPELGLVGSVDQAVERAGELIKKGVEGFHVIVPGGERGRACLERLLGEVRPQLA